MKKPFLSLLAMCALASSSWAQSTNADNTAVNARDQKQDRLDATDQSNSPEDIKLTAAIRRMVMADASLSMAAKNSKIITINSIVTLRGPVDSKKEKLAIAAYAREAGAKKVDNLLEVKKTK